MQFGDTPLLRAMHAIDRTDIARWLLAHGASTDVRDKSGNTPLLVAAGNGLLELTKMLVAEAGASVAEKDDDGTTPLLLSIRFGHIPIARWLLENGASLQEKNKFGTGAVLSAAVGGHLYMMKWVLRQGCAPDSSDFRRCNALHMAAHFGNVPLARFMLTQGLSAQSRDTDHTTPLIIAAHRGQLQFVRWLLDSGLSSLDERNRFGETAMHSACLGSSLLVAQEIAKRNPAAPWEVDAGGNSAVRRHKHSPRTHTLCLHIVYPHLISRKHSDSRPSY